MKLILAEKPSVAQSIAKVLGVNQRKDGYLEGNGYLVSWCVGHLVELAQPEVYDERYGKWKYEDLPIFPEDWKYMVSTGTKKQFGILKKLMDREDVSSLICATDAGREGELIFRLVYQQCNCRKPFERLWISSMEDTAIREGFEHLRPGNEYDALYEAAMCRERADWMVGINATRLFSCLYGQTLNVGRVMTPTLAMTVMREAAIAAFRPETFYTVQLAFDDFSVSGDRIKDKELAACMADSCMGKNATITKVERKERSEKPPALYDLTSLQRDANRILGFTAQQTLNYAQNLYEKKLLTYPRTDSRYLTDDMESLIPDLISRVAPMLSIAADEIPIHTGNVINSKKVSDHHAILPTKEAANADISALPKGEQEILQLVSTRLVCAVGEVHRYSETMIEAECEGNLFTAKGKSILDPGWKRYEKRQDSTRKEIDVKTPPDMNQGEVFTVNRSEIKEGKTSPPKHYTEDTLLQSMERAGAEEVPEDAERKGLGTPATRAGIIEKLVRVGFLERKGDKKVKYLIPTHKGNALVTVMPEQIQSASMTAEWEEKLKQIEKQEYHSEQFMEEIQEMIAALIKTYEVVKDAEVLIPKEANIIGQCPVCGSDVTEKSKAFFCSDRKCGFALWKKDYYFENIGKSMTAATAKKLLSTGKIALKGCMSKKSGHIFDAVVRLEVNEKNQARFSMEFENGGK